MRNIWASCLLLMAIGLTACLPEEIIHNAKPRTRDKPIDHYEEYSYTPKYPKEILLNEEFNNNSRGWRVVNISAQYSMSISGGELTMVAKNNIKQQNNINLPEFKETDNFEIEARLKVATNNNSTDLGQGNSLQWGLTTTAPGRWLYYGLDNADVQIRIGFFNGQIYVNEYSSLSNSHERYYQDTYNLITVRKVNNTCYYFINGAFIKKNTAPSFYGSRIGFGVDAYSTIQVDYLKVSRLTVN